MKNYTVIVTRHSRNMTLDEARKYSIAYRSFGYGTEIVTNEESIKRESEQQQDLQQYYSTWQQDLLQYYST